MFKHKGMPNGPQYRAGFDQAGKDLVNHGFPYVNALARMRKEFPLDWYLVGYSTRLNMAVESGSL
jgi:hypothetical protein